MALRSGLLHKNMTNDKYYIYTPCATEYCPDVDPQKMPGITCAMDTACDYCGAVTNVCPVRDDHYASGDKRREWD